MGTKQAYGIILNGKSALHVFCCFLCFDCVIGGWVLFSFALMPSHDDKDEIMKTTMSKR
jgi:hypothetical protein